MFTPSPQQSAFFHALAKGQGNIILSAAAGSGKTTTLIEGLKTLPVFDPESFQPPATLFLAFNKSIAETLKARCPRHVACSTFHSLGFSALKRSGIISEKDARKRDFVNGRKMSKLLYNSLGDSPDVRDASRLASIARSTSTPPDSIDEPFLASLTSHYGFLFDEPSRVFAAVAKAIASASRDLSCIDFDEMLYLPIVLGAKFEKQDYVFVDEAQDTNDIQLEILGRIAKPSYKAIVDKGNVPFRPTRYVFVGDPHQAIYGFRGANSDSMSRITTRFACTEMPLDVSFRCPQAIVAEARKALQLT